MWHLHRIAEEIAAQEIVPYTLYPKTEFEVWAVSRLTETIYAALFRSYEEGVVAGREVKMRECFWRHHGCKEKALREDTSGKMQCRNHNIDFNHMPLLELSVKVAAICKDTEQEGNLNS